MDRQSRPAGVDTILCCTFLLLTIQGPPAATGTHPERTVLLRADSVGRPARDSILALFGAAREEVVLSSLRDTLYLLATPAEADVLFERGHRIVEVMRDSSEAALARRALFGPAMTLPPGYRTYAEIVQQAVSLEQRFPRLVRTETIGTTSQEGRSIIAVHITGPRGNPLDKPAILFTGCHHADELLGAEICTALMRTLAEGYGRDSAWTDRVDRFRIVIVPVLNVDGHHVVTSGTDPRWRKNTRDLNGNGVLYERGDGVDINRNYDFNWAHGGSGEPSSERYRGPYPFSEAENRAMLSLATEHRFLLAATYHSSGEVIYYPWDWRGRKAPDDQLLTAIARRFASAIRTMEGDSSYQAEYGAGTVGQSYPWLYGRFGTFDFVVETALGAHIVPEADRDPIVVSNIAGLRALFEAGGGPGVSGRVTDAKTGRPLQAAIRIPAIDTEEIDHRTSHPASGRFWRLLSPGLHTILVTADGFEPAVLRDVRVGETSWTDLRVPLQPHSGRKRR